MIVCGAACLIKSKMTALIARAEPKLAQVKSALRWLLDEIEEDFFALTVVAQSKRIAKALWAALIVAFAIATLVMAARLIRDTVTQAPIFKSQILFNNESITFPKVTICVPFFARELDMYAFLEMKRSSYYDDINTYFNNSTLTKQMILAKPTIYFRYHYYRYVDYFYHYQLEHAEWPSSISRPFKGRDLSYVNFTDDYYGYVDEPAVPSVGEWTPSLVHIVHQLLWRMSAIEREPVHTSLEEIVDQLAVSDERKNIDDEANAMRVLVTKMELFNITIAELRERFGQQLYLQMPIYAMHQQYSEADVPLASTSFVGEDRVCFRYEKLSAYPNNTEEPFMTFTFNKISSELAALNLRGNLIAVKGFLTIDFQGRDYIEVNREVNNAGVDDVFILRLKESRAGETAVSVQQISESLAEVRNEDGEYHCVKDADQVNAVKMACQNDWIWKSCKCRATNVVAEKKSEAVHGKTCTLLDYANCLNRTTIENRTQEISECQRKNGAERMKTCDQWKLKFTFQPSNTPYLASVDALVEVSLRMENLNYLLATEGWKVGAMEFIGAFGGIIGLFIGWNFSNFLHILLVILEAIVGLFRKKKNAVTPLSDVSSEEANTLALVPRLRGRAVDVLEKSCDAIGEDIYSLKLILKASNVLIGLFWTILTIGFIFLTVKDTRALLEEYNDQETASEITRRRASSSNFRDFIVCLPAFNFDAWFWPFCTTGSQPAVDHLYSEAIHFLESADNRTIGNLLSDEMAAASEAVPVPLLEQFDKVLAHISQFEQMFNYEALDKVFPQTLESGTWRPSTEPKLHETLVTALLSLQLSSKELHQAFNRWMMRFYRLEVELHVTGPRGERIVEEMKPTLMALIDSKSKYCFQYQLEQTSLFVINSLSFIKVMAERPWPVTLGYEGAFALNEERITIYWSDMKQLLAQTTLGFIPNTHLSEQSLRYKDKIEVFFDDVTGVQHFEVSLAVVYKALSEIDGIQKCIPSAGRRDQQIVDCYVCGMQEICNCTSALPAFSNLLARKEFCKLNDFQECKGLVKAIVDNEDESDMTGTEKWTNYTKNCQCQMPLPECDQQTLRIRHVSALARRQGNNDQTLNYVGDKKSAPRNASVEVRLYWASFSTIVYTEEWQWKRFDFVGVLGGTLGLWLGWSFTNIFHLIIEPLSLIIARLSSAICGQFRARLPDFCSA